MSSPNEHYPLASRTEWEHMDMDVNEMLNSFDTHPERKFNIIRMYSRKFGQSMVTIQATCDGPADTNISKTDSGDEIHIRGQKMWLHYFNLFGPVITRLTIDYSEFTDAQCRKLHKLVGHTCAGNLIEIEFVGINQDNSIDDLANYQFPNVKRVEIVDSTLCGRLPLFSALFPNVRILKIVDVSLDCFDAYFKDLDRFVIVKDGIDGARNVINVICRDW